MRGRLDTGRSEGHRVQICASREGTGKTSRKTTAAAEPGTQPRSSSRSRPHVEAKALPRTLWLSPHGRGSGLSWAELQTRSQVLVKRWIPAAWSRGAERSREPQGAPPWTVDLTRGEPHTPAPRSPCLRLRLPAASPPLLGSVFSRLPRLSPQDFLR